VPEVKDKWLYTSTFIDEEERKTFFIKTTGKLINSSTKPTFWTLV
jgi:hypothetical protein